MNITELAKKHLLKIKEKEGKYPRLFVQGGGCSGFSYIFNMADPDDDDMIIDEILLVDPISFSILENATVEYINDLTGSYFKVNIPEAKSFCGCGTSFSLG